MYDALILKREGKIKMKIVMQIVVVVSATIGCLAVSENSAANKVGELDYSSTEPGHIHFDAAGNIIDSSLPKTIHSRATINHSSGRWVYYSEKSGNKKIGNSNHYSHMYNRHGAKAKVGSVVKSANATNKKWAYAKATGGKNDTFSCWYNPTGWY